MKVTHPFHALAGQQLEILYLKRRGDGLVFVCARDGGRSVTLPQEWTDRGPQAESYRLSPQGLQAARALIDALTSPGATAGGGGS